ncbi:MAG TPA: proline--tRNA ligase, partial [Gammaproteobacteria bacterium]|nr:proline--tRNA ligase [Gammaproteobacteria bacterium]
TGNIGGTMSHEFHVLAAAGEDRIAFSTESDYAANIELAEALPPQEPRPAATAPLETIDTPGQYSITELSRFLDIEPSRCLKTLLVEAARGGGVVALVLRGDHELNIHKANKLPEVATPVRFATAEQVRAVAGCDPGSLGPRGLTIPVIADYSAAQLADFVCGANQDGKHLTGVNWGRDLPEPAVADLREVVEGDPSPDGKGTLRIARGIEVGHIFQLGDKYSRAMQATCLNQNGEAMVLLMGCYGIGVSRLVAAAIEQNHDDHGIIWPLAIAPFQVAIAPINLHKSERLQAIVEILYKRLCEAGIEVLLYDRRERPGVIFADLDLIGIPHRLVLSDRSLDHNTVEYKGRRDQTAHDVPHDAIVGFIKQRLAEHS